MREDEEKIDTNKPPKKIKMGLSMEEVPDDPILFKKNLNFPASKSVRVTYEEKKGYTCKISLKEDWPAFTQFPSYIIDLDQPLLSGKGEIRIAFSLNSNQMLDVLAYQIQNDNDQVEV